MAKKTNATNPIDTRKLFKREVPKRLGEAEALELHDRAQQIDARADELEAKLKEDVKERKLRIDTLRAEAERDRSAAAKREQLVEVDCYEELQGTTIVVYEAATRVKVDERAATPEERQDSIPGLDDGGDLPLPPDYSTAAPANDGEEKPDTKKRGSRKR
jgi:hypothetical protein